LKISDFGFWILRLVTKLSPGNAVLEGLQLSWLLAKLEALGETRSQAGAWERGVSGSLGAGVSWSLRARGKRERGVAGARAAAGARVAGRARVARGARNSGNFGLELWGGDRPKLIRFF